MKIITCFIILVLSCISTSSFGQEIFEMEDGDTTFVMQQYFMCFLYRGDRSGYDSAQLTHIQAGHMEHISHLAEENKISVAGPFGDDQDMRGIIIFHVATIEEAKSLQAEDPAIKAGVLVMDIRPWWAGKGSVLK